MQAGQSIDAGGERIKEVSGSVRWGWRAGPAGLGLPRGSVSFGTETEIYGTTEGEAIALQQKQKLKPKLVLDLIRSGISAVPDAPEQKQNKLQIDNHPAEDPGRTDH